MNPQDQDVKPPTQTPPTPATTPTPPPPPTSSTPVAGTPTPDAGGKRSMGRTILILLGVVLVIGLLVYLVF